MRRIPIGPGHLFKGVALAISLALAAPAVWAQQSIGAVTKLELPRFVSMKTSEAFARRGPGKVHKIDWTFVRRHLPLKVVAEHGHWRRVEDDQGKGGWIHYALLSRTRTVLVTQDNVEMFAKPAGQSRLIARLQAGVVGKLITCEAELCKLEASDAAGQPFEGWVRKSALWGLTQGD